MNLTNRQWIFTILFMAVALGSAWLSWAVVAHRPKRLKMPLDCFPAHPVSPSSPDIPYEGRLSLKEILGEEEAKHVFNAVCSPYVMGMGLMHYKRTEITTTIHVPAISTNSFSAEQFLSGEAYAVETDTFIVLTIDNRTGKILIPEGTPSISRRELDAICRPLLKGTYAADWEIWMDSVRRVSDWYVVYYRRQKQPFREGDRYICLVFWINAWTRRAFKDEFTIEYADS